MPGGIKGRVKAIIMDKAPKGDQIKMQAEFGFQTPDYQALATEFNAAFGTQVTESDLSGLQTVDDVVIYMESL